MPEMGCVYEVEEERRSKCKGFSGGLENKGEGGHLKKLAGGKEGNCQQEEPEEKETKGELAT